MYLYSINKDKETKLPYLARRYELIDVADYDEYDEDDMINLLRLNFDLDILDIEENYVIGLDNYNRIQGVYCIAKGDYKSVDMFTRNLSIFLLLSGTRKFNVFHNHPDNAIEGSANDFTNFGSMMHLANVIGLEFQDSYILCPDGWCKLSMPNTINEYTMSLDKERSVEYER